jgi:hypothetical protein
VAFPASRPFSADASAKKSEKYRVFSISGLAHLDDFYHKMRKTDRHCERSDAIQKSAKF